MSLKAPDTKTEYKDTPIGEIPKNWEVVTVNEVFHVETGTTPSTKNKSYWNGGIVWFTPNDLSGLENKPEISNSERKITKEAIKETNLSLLEPESIILSTRAPVGYAAVCKKRYTFNQGCKALVPKLEKKVSPKFYYYYLKFKRKELEFMSGRTTFQELTKSLLKKLKIPLPSFFEQKKIAEILFTVDEAIQKVDDAIEKTKQLKKGLMQELLIEGIGHDEFKETEIGTIPEEWEICKIKDIAKVKYGKALPENNGNTPAVGSSGIYDHVEKPLVEHPTIIVGRKGSAGMPYLIKNPSWPSDTTFFLDDINGEEINLQYLYYHMLFYLLSGEHAKTTLPSLKRGRLEGYIIKTPTLSEQEKIVKILSAVDEKRKLERKRKKKFVRIKKGLMQDLLTGRKRVKV